MPSPNAVNKDQVPSTISIVVELFYWDMVARHPANWQHRNCFFNETRAHARITHTHTAVERRQKRDYFVGKKQNSWLKFRVFVKCFEHFSCAAFFRQLFPSSSSVFIYFAIEPNANLFCVCVCVALSKRKRTCSSDGIFFFVFISLSAIKAPE